VLTVLPVWQSEGHATTRPSPFQRHHQTWLLWRSAPPCEFEAEGSVPAVDRSMAMLGKRKIRLPDERAIGKKPEIFACQILQ
jgi:hypothetical protein